MKKPRRYAATVILLFLVNGVSAQTALFSETFDSVPLGAAVDEDVVVVEFWSNFTTGASSGIPGWSIDNSELPGGGTTEWRGWSFVDPDLWATTDLQNRGQFQKGENVIAVADPDEWDDRPNDPGLYNTFLRTPSIPIGVTSESSLTLQFDSSWRPEGRDEDPDGPGPLPQGANNQTAVIKVAYDGGDFSTEVLRWESDSISPFYKPDATNETPTVDVPLPAGVTSLQLEFGLIDAGNDWWWAIDNIGLFDGDPTLAISVDRDTGEIALTNNTNADIGIKGYAITSLDGALDRNAFSPQAAADSEWIEFRGAEGEFVVGEGHLTTGLIPSDAEISVGQVWNKYQVESDDLRFTYLDESGDTIEGIVRFSGNGGSSFEAGDLNFDGTVDELDWPAVRDNFGTDLSALSSYEAYRSGDVTGDRNNNLDDFLRFKSLYIAANGQASFAALLAGAAPVPEPSCVVMATAAIFGLWAGRRWIRV